MKKAKKITKKVSFPSELLKSFISNKIRRERLLLLFSVVVFVSLIVIGTHFNIFSPQISSSQTVREAAVRKGEILSGQPVKWLKVVAVSEIGEGRKYLRLPKDAENITIKTGQAAIAVIKEKSGTKLTIEERKNLLASIQSKDKKPSIIARLWQSLTASVKDVVEQIEDAFKEEDKEKTKEGKIEIIETTEGKFIDLTSAVENVVQPEEVIDVLPQEEAEPLPEEIPAQEEVIQPIEDNPPAEEATPPVEETVPPTEELVSEEITQPVEDIPVDEIAPSPEETVAPAVEDPLPEDLSVTEYVAVEYTTPAPQITEEKTSEGKQVTVSAPDELEYTDVLAFSSIPEIYKVGQEDKIHIKWKNPDCAAIDDLLEADTCRDSGYISFAAYDTDNNGKLDYVEWTVPHLSEQVFEIILVSRAWQLDENLEITGDVYDQVVAKDGDWATIPQNNYIRATFGQILDNTRDNTIYAKPSDEGQPVTVEVYPVYKNNDEELYEGDKIATFPLIEREGTYTILLTSLSGPTDVFDLKVIGGSLDVDWVVDPVCTSQGTGNWNTAGTWSCGHVPTTSDSVVVADTHTVTVDVNTAAVTALTINAGGVLTEDGGSRIITVVGNWTNNGTFTANTETALVRGTATILGNTTFNNLTFYNPNGDADSTFTIGSAASTTTLTVNGTLTLDGTSISRHLTINTGNTDTAVANVNVLGNVTITTNVNGSSNAGTGGGNANIVIAGTEDQTITGHGTIDKGALPKVVINRASETEGKKLFLSSVITVRGWEYIAGTVDVTTNSNTVVFDGTMTVTGSMAFNNLTFYDPTGGGDITVTIGSSTVPTTLTVNNALTITGRAGARSVYLVTGNTDTSLSNINALGDVTVADSTYLNGSGTGSTAVITFTGSAVSQTFTGNGTALMVPLGKIVVNKSDGTLYLASVITVSSWAWSAGTVDAGTSTIVFGTGRGKTVNTDSMVFNDVVFNSAGDWGDTVITGTMLVGGNFTLSGYVWNTSGAISVAGNFTCNTTNFLGTQNYTVTLNGTGTQTLSKTANSFTSGAVTINKSSGTVVFSTNGGTLTNNITLSTDATVQVDSTNTFTLSGIISGGYALSKAGDGTLTLSGANTFTGGLTIKAGTVSLTTSTSAGGGTGTGTITLGNSTASSDAVTLKGDTRTFANPIVLADIANHTGTITISTTGNATFSGAISGTNDLTLTEVSSNALTLSNASINNAGTITNTGVGTGVTTISGVMGASVTGVVQNSATSNLKFSGINSNFSGGVIIKAGTLVLGNSTASAGTGTITIGDSTGTANAILRNDNSITYPNTITVATGSSGTATISSAAAATYSGAVTLNKNLTLTNATGGGDLALSGAISGAGNITISSVGTKTVTLSNAVGGINNTGTITNSGAGSGTVTISGIIGAEVTGVIQNSATSQLTLSGNNTFTGKLYIMNGTVLGSTNATAFGASTAADSITLGCKAADTATCGSANATLTSSGSLTFVNPITVASGTSGTLKITGQNFSVYSGAIALSNNLTLSNDGVGGTTNYSGGITGTGNITITKVNGYINLTTNAVNMTGTITHTGSSTGGDSIAAVIGTNVTGVTQNSATDSLTLSGVNTYTGPITNSAGTLNLTQTTAYSTMTLAGDSTTKLTIDKILTLTSLVSTGTAGHLANLQASATGHAHVTTASAQIATDYLAVTDIVADQANTWFYGANGTASGTTTNWGSVPDTTPPTQSAWSPKNNAAITTATPTITLTLNEAGDCRLSLLDDSYDLASDDTDCTGDGTTSITCVAPDLGTDGAKTVHIACQDSLGNKDSNSTNTDLTYNKITTTGTLRYWIDTDGGNWNDIANWSTTSGGAGGSSVPVSTSDAIFDGNGNGDCTVDATVNVKGLFMAGYSGTITQGAYTVTVGTDGMSIGSGTLNGSASAVTLSGAFTMTGGTWTLGAQTVTVAGSAWTYVGGTLDATTNGSTVKFTTTSTILGSMTFGGLEFNAAVTNQTNTIGSASVPTTLTVNGTLTSSGGSSRTVILNTGNTDTALSNINAKGNITVTNTSNNNGGGSAIITINGTEDQTLTGSGVINQGKLPNIVINRTSETAGKKLFLKSTISVAGNWTYTAGTVDTIANANTVVFTYTSTILGSMTFNDLEFFAAVSGQTNTIGSPTIPTTLTVNGILTLSGPIRALILNTGNTDTAISNIDAKGNIIITLVNSDGGGSAIITINGTEDQTLTGSGTASQGDLPNVTIAKDTGTLTLASVISVAGAWTYTSGTVDATTNDSTVVLYGTKNLDGQGTSATMSFDNLQIGDASNAASITLAGDLSVAGNLNISTSRTLNTSASNYAVNVGGNWTRSGTFTGNNSTVTLTSGTHTVTGANTFYGLTLDAPNTITFPSATTQTISNAMSCTGTAGNIITINASTPTSAATLSKASGTVTCDYLSLTDSTATGGATWNAGYYSTSVSNNTGWTGFNVAPNAPTLVSPATASYTTDNTPTLSAIYSDPDANDVGSVNYRISTGTTTDCTNNTSVIAWGASSETASNDVATTWAPGSSIGSDATYSWCAQNNDGVATSAWTAMGSFILDTANPTATITGPTDSTYYTNTSVSFSASGSDTNLGSLVPNLDSSLGGWWTMDEVDGAGNPLSHTGANNGGKQGNAAQTAANGGRYNKGFAFDGTGDYINIADSPSLESQSFSIFAWVNTNSVADGGAIFGKNLAYEFFKNGQQLKAGFWNGSAWTYCNTGNTVTATGTWYFVGLTYDGTNCAFYNNNNTVSVFGNPKSVSISDNANDVVIGQHIQDDTDWNGSMDDVMYFSRVVTSDERTALYNGTAISHSSTLSEASHTYKVYAEDLAGNVGVSTTNTFTVDATAPAGGSVSYTNGYFTSASVSITYSTGTDSGSGLATATGKLQRAVADLAAGVCDTFGSFSDLVTEYDGSYSDAAVTTGHCYKYRYLIQDNATNQATYTSDNVAKVDVDAPITSADGSGYTFGEWTNESSVSVTLTCLDNSGSGCVATYYCTDALNTCTPITVYGSPVSVATAGNSYIRYYSTDAASSAETPSKSQTIKIDASGPSVNAGDDKVRNTQFTQTGSADDAGGSGVASYLWSKVSGPGTVTFGSATLAETTVSVSVGGDYVIRLTATDNAGNPASDDFSLEWSTYPVLAEVTAVTSPSSDSNPTYTFSSTKAGSITYGGSCSSTTTSASVGNNTIAFNTLTNGSYSNCTIVVTDGDGYASSPLAITSFAVAAGIQDGSGSISSGSNDSYTPPALPEALQAPQASPIDIIAEQLNNVAVQVENILNPAGAQPQIQYPPISVSVPKEAPPALRGLEIMSVNPLGKFSLAPIGTSVSFFADKLSPLKETLDALGINADKLSDVKKLSQAELYLPGLTQTVLSPEEVLKANILATGNEPPAVDIAPGNQTGLIKPDSLQASAFAAVQGVPLAQLSSEALDKMPTDLIFARTSGGLIDISSALVVDGQGNAGQRITAISGKPLDLIIRPDSPASRVTGLITLKTLQNAEAEPKNKGIASRLLTAALTAANPASAERSSASSGLLLQKFDYAEVRPGVFKASISAPTAEGQYEVVTVVEYKDQSLSPTETRLTAIIDPEGYVYRQVADGRLRIENAEVSIYWLNPETKKYELWQAEKFLQKNPILTNDTGKYSFLVPQGTYYLAVSATTYSDFKSDPFVVNQDNGVKMDIELKKKTIMPEWFNWEMAITALLLIILIFICIFTFAYIKGRNINLKKR